MLAQGRASSPGNLDRALRRSRRAWWSNAARDVVASAVAVAAASMVITWVAAWLAARTGPMLPLGSVLESTAARWALSAFVVTLAIGGLIALARSPSRLELARAVDRRAGLQQLLSTAWEVVTRGGPRTVVAHALVSAAEARSADLDVRPVWRRSDTRLLPAALAALLVAVATVLVPVPERRAATGRTPAPQATLALPTAADVETLKAATRLLDLVAERQDSAYLRAVASSYAELSTGLEAGSVTAAEATSTMQELSEHLLAAAEEIGGAFGEAIAAAMTSPRAGADQVAPSDAAAQPAPEARPAGAPDQWTPAAGAASGPTAESSASSPFEMLNAVVEMYEADPTSLGLPPPRAQGVRASDLADFYGGVMRAETDPNAALLERPAGPRAAGEGGGDVAGAAQRSSESAGDAAGQGGADLGVGSDAFLSLDVESSLAAALPRNEREDGRFTEMELLPSTRTGIIAVPYDLSSIPAFERADEAAFTEGGIGDAYRDAVSRYFTPSSSVVE